MRIAAVANAVGESGGQHQLHGGIGKVLGRVLDDRFLDAPDCFVIADMAAVTGYALREADDHFEAQAAKDATVNASGALKTVAVSMFKIANDLRWLSSGPRTGIAEIRLPSLQPGSSIMPGKVNPVMSEMMMQVCSQVIGNDSAITWGGANGNFELNVMMPLIVHNLLESISLLASAAVTFADKCVAGIVANVDRARELAERNIIVVTALNPHIGYDNAAKIAKKAHADGTTLKEAAIELGLLTSEEFDKAVRPEKMIGPKA